MRFKDIIKEVMTSTKREPLRSEPKCESPVVPVDHIGTGTIGGDGDSLFTVDGDQYIIFILKDNINHE